MRITMRTVKWTPKYVGALCGIALIGMIGCDRLLNSDQVTNEPASRNTSESKTSEHIYAEIWTCPMHPQVRKDGPGKCPICGMDLVKAESLGTAGTVRSDSPEGHAPFRLSQNRIQMIGVKYGTVEKRLIFKSIEASGRVAFDPELYTAQNEYVEAIKQLSRVQDAPISEVKHSASRMVESTKLRLKILGLSDQQILDLRKTAGSSSTGSNLLITSPGESLWIYADIFEMDLPHISQGQSVRISGPYLEKELQGKVVSVDRVINPNTRTAKVRILVPDTHARLRPEAYVDVAILSPLGENVVVPFDSVLDSGKESWVFVVHEDGHFEPRKVVIRDYVGEEISIASGLHAGEKIVTSGNFLIDSESRLKGVLTSQAESRDSSDLKEGDPNHAPSVPECPKGQVWHEQMKHCMTKVGE